MLLEVSTTKVTSRVAKVSGAGTCGLDDEREVSRVVLSMAQERDLRRVAAHSVSEHQVAIRLRPREPDVGLRRPPSLDVDRVGRRREPANRQPRVDPRREVDRIGAAPLVP